MQQPIRTPCRVDARPRSAAAFKLLCCAAGICVLWASPATATPTCTATGARVRTMSLCRYGAPVVVNRTLFVPKACRLPLGGKVIERHAVELRDATTGRKLGQASLPAKAATLSTAPPPGALIGGPYPLYVWSGGIAAIDVSSKRARVVYEPTGQVAGVARLGEILSIVDRLPQSKGAPKGALEWTVLDFGAGEILGQLMLRDTKVLDVGLTKKGGQLTGWLGLVGPKGPADLVAVIRGKDGKPVAKKGRLQASGAARGKRQMAMASGAKLATSAREKKPVCAVLTGRDAVLPGDVLVDLHPAGGYGPHTAARTLPIAACAASTAAAQNGAVWAWVRPKPAVLALQAYRCVAGVARTKGKRKSK